MTIIPHIVRRRTYKTRPGKKTLLGGAAFGCSLIISLFLIFSGVAVSLFYIYLTRDLPSLEIFPLYLDPPDGLLLKPTVLYDRSGENILLILRDPGAVDAKYLRVSRDNVNSTEYFSSVLVQAVTAEIDPTFWESENSTIRWLLYGDENTLAQRMVEETVLWDESEGLLHDLRVRLVASQIIHQYGREKVFEWFLNSAKFGELLYGADAAARVYLGKSASELDLAEGALLAAIAGAPDINPFSVPDLSLDRQKKLIQSMMERGYITYDEAMDATDETIIFTDRIENRDDFEAFTGFVLAQLSSIIPRKRLEKGGLRVITSMDYDLQIQTQCALITQMARVQHEQREISTINGETCEAARLLPTILSNGDGFPQDIDAAAAISDPEKGQLLTLVVTANEAGESTELLSFPSGSVLTPYIYLTAFTRGFNPGSMVWDIPGDTNQIEVINQESTLDRRINSIETYHGPIRLRTALANDYLRPAVNLMNQVGSENVLRTLSRFGMQKQSIPVTPVDLNQLMFEEDVNLIDTVRAYGILANRGVLSGQSLGITLTNSDMVNLELSGIIRIEDASGKTLVDWSAPQSRSIVSPQLAYLVTDILSDDSARWESMGHPNPLEIGRPAAVKMSRTLDGNGTWVLGYTPNKVVGVRLSSAKEDVATLDQRIGAGLWHAIIQYSLHDEPVVNWELPPGIVLIEVCSPSGMLPTSNCPLVVTEVFLAGQEPTHTDTLYRSFQVNRETGNLATVFTPPELIDERIYMVVTPTAEEWAREHNLPVPPGSYDAIAVPANAIDGVNITSPEMFSSVHGLVKIEGSAGGSGFSYYRLQVGQGLNPEKWIQIGKDYTEPVNEDILAVWDTSGLNGLYAVKLLVVRQDQRVDEFVFQVTVDNQQPEIEVLSPENEQKLSLVENEIIIIRAEANDDIELEGVEFYLDESLLAVVKKPPYIIPWEMRAGAHKLLVIARDMAGNVNQEYIEFTVKR